MSDRYCEQTEFVRLLRKIFGTKMSFQKFRAWPCFTKAYASQWARRWASRWALAAALIVCSVGLIGGQPAWAQAVIEAAPTSAPAVPNTQALFEAHCSSCHAHGGNLIRRGKNLQQKTLLRNGYGEMGAIATLITQGKGVMPAYADRLGESEIEAIAQYVLEQAKTGWP